MNSFKYSVVFMALAISMTAGHPFFHHKKVVEIPVHLKPVHLQPVILEKPEIHEIHHIEHSAPVPTTPAGPTESPHAHWQRVWDQVKNSVGNHKFVRHFYHKKSQPETHVPEFNVWPSLGFSHYKKVNYIPVVPTQAPVPNHVEFDYLPQDFAGQGFPDTLHFSGEIPREFQTFNQHNEIPSFIESSNVPKDFESSNSGGQINHSTVPEQTVVKVVPSPPATSYGLPIQN